MKGFIFSGGANFGRMRVHDRFRKGLAKTVAGLTNPVIRPGAGDSGRGTD
jgi:hypothetical protein